jgi:hypothetical protein
VLISLLTRKRPFSRKKKEQAQAEIEEDIISFAQEHIVKTNAVQDMTEDVVSDNLPVQVDVQEPDNTEFDDLALPQEVLQILNTQSEQTQPLFKKRGRPSKKNADTINAPKTNDHSQAK